MNFYLYFKNKTGNRPVVFQDEIYRLFAVKRDVAYISSVKNLKSSKQ